MEGDMTTGDIIIGLLAAAGVVVLIGVFIWVVRLVFWEADRDENDV